MIPRGEDFTDEQIATWFDDEQNGYFNLHGSAQERPEYDALNELTLFRFVRGQRFDACLALGAARGLDIETIAPLVSRFIIIEPTREYWRPTIGGKPADYRAPTLRAKIDLPNASADLTTAIGVLHHVPNVSEALSELHRILKPGALLLIREPIVSMGDWRKPRHGLTMNERGLPMNWLLSTLRKIGFEIDRATLCNFGPMARLCHSVGVDPYQKKWTTRLDLLLSAASAWNARYDRPGLFRKLAPASVAVVARKL